MSDKKHTKPKAVYNPGELDKTRKNIGKISKEEATKLAQRLGGDIGVEKSVNYSEALIKKKRTYAHKNISDTSIKDKSAAVKPPNPIISPNSPGRTALPHINSKDKSAIDKLMASPEYHIKPNHGIFTFFFNITKGGNDRVSPDFILNTLHNHIAHLQRFVSSVTSLTNHASEAYNKQILENPDTYYKTIKIIREWNIAKLRDQYTALEQKANECTVTMLIPFTRTLYQFLLTLYFLGDAKIIEYIKRTYGEIVPHVKYSHETLFQYAKEAAVEWMYIYGQIVKGLYPLLLRMSCNTYEEFSELFSTRISKVLTFLNLTKYDILLPKKEFPIPIQEVQTGNMNTTTQDESVKEEGIPPFESTEEEKTKEIIEESSQNKSTSELVQKGLDLLNTLFPEAGWNIISTMPDMYPYYQTLYSFNDGFNLISPDNPMQITLILQRILEDFFQGCRNIKFSIDKEPDFSNFEDNLFDIFSEWSLYREYVCERLYLTELKDYVNHIYTQSDFGISPYAKKKLSNLLWQTKYLFLPHLSFELVFMERPDKDATYKPIPKRVEYLKALFSILISRVEQNMGYQNMSEKKVNLNDDLNGAANLFLPYRFEVPNVISKRIDVLLGGKKSKNANNFNLLKYSLCIIAVMDWWINNPDSPGYSIAGILPYRVSHEDGTPIFSIPTRNDQNSLFLHAIKAKSIKSKETET